MIYPVLELVQDFPHIPAPILMQGLMTCPEHISWYSIGLNFLKTPLVIRQLTWCRIATVHMIYPVPELVQDFPHIPAPILMQGLMTCPKHISWYSIGLNFLKTFL